MKVSAVICTLAREKELGQCLESLINQSRKPDEIVIVSRKPLNLRQARTIVQKGKGLPDARNAAIRNTDSDIVVFFDDDTVVHRDYIKNMLKAFARLPDAGGLTGKITEENRETNKQGMLGKLMGFYAHAFGISGFFANCSGIGKVLDTGFTASNFDRVEKTVPVEWLSGCNMAYRREAIEKTGFFDTGFIGNAYYEDADYSYRVLRKGFSLYAVPDCVVRHLVSPVKRESLPRLKYYQLVNQKRFFRKNVYNGSALKLLKHAIAHAALLIPVLAYSIYFRNLDMLKSYLEAEARR